MFKYSCAAGNPEGTDWVLLFEHEKKFTREEFQDICEEVLAQCLDDMYSKKGWAYVLGLDTDEIFKKFEEKGFISPKEKSTSYYLEPYWGKDRIKSKRLIECIDREDKKENFS